MHVCTCMIKVQNGRRWATDPAVLSAHIQESFGSVKKKTEKQEIRGNLEYYIVLLYFWMAAINSIIQYCHQNSFPCVASFPNRGDIMRWLARSNRSLLRQGKIENKIDLKVYSEMVGPKYIVCQLQYNNTMQYTVHDQVTHRFSSYGFQTSILD